jgi:hypothetical protein
MSIAQGLPEAAERVQPVQDVPLWSENLCFTGWDPERGIGVFVHTGRTPIDPELWHEIVVVHLPGGRILAGKNFSRGSTADGPSGSLLRTQCLEPFRAWSIAFTGPLRSVSEDELASAALADGPQPGGRLELRFESELPVWDFGSHGAGDWARRHYQQLGTLAGTLLTDGLETRLEMDGWRDHSAGVRNMAPFLRHVLVTAQFEDGRSLYAVQLEDSGSDRPFVLGRLGDGPSVTDLQLVGLPPIDDARAPSPTYEFELGGPSRPMTVRAEMLCILPVTMYPPNDMVIGVSSGPGAYVLWMGQARFTLDGVTGYGHVERAGLIG